MFATHEHCIFLNYLLILWMVHNSSWSPTSGIGTAGMMQLMEVIEVGWLRRVSLVVESKEGTKQ